MIQGPEYAFGWSGQTVIKRGDRVEQEQRENIYGVSDDLKGIAGHRGRNYQNCAAGECEDCTDQVGNTVKPFAFVHE